MRVNTGGNYFELELDTSRIKLQRVLITSTHSAEKCLPQFLKHDVIEKCSLKEKISQHINSKQMSDVLQVTIDFYFILYSRKVFKLHESHNY